MTKISFVYFDVGGVAIKDFSDTDKWDKMFAELGFGNQAEIAKKIYMEHDDAICLGQMKVEDLIPIYKEKLGINFADTFDFLQSFIDRFAKNDDLQSIVDLAKSKVKVGLLTDIYLGMLERIDNKGLLPLASWDTIIDSSVVKVRKPMPEIYQLAQERANVPANEILFVDNRQKNLDGAKLAGWQTFLYDSSNYDQANKDLADFLAQNL